MNRFLERAEKFGHNISRLNAGDEIHTIRSVKDIDELRDLMHDGATDAQRSARVAIYQADHPSLMDESNTTPAALHLRAAAAVHADRALSAADRLALERHFPMNVNLLSAQNKTINSEWCLGKNGVPFSLNLGTLVINTGGFISAYATAVNLGVQNLINNAQGGSVGVNYTIGIFGVDGAAGAAGNPGVSGTPPSAIAAPGGDGSNSNTPSPGVCTGASAAGNGANGATGVNGGVGGTGADGSPNLLATFNFEAMQGSPVYLLTRSGAGGAGGIGGAGQQGGPGGTGGAGCQSGCEGTPSGNGGNGGPGGTGGLGGRGGNGVNGNPITITLGQNVPQSMVPNSGASAAQGQPGAGGHLGLPGAAGVGGTSSGKNRSGGSPGVAGAPGTTGGEGTAGQYSGSPGNVSFS